VGLDDLREIDDFQIFKQYIKQFILENEDLYRCIYFCFSDPFDEDKCPMPDKRLDIFDASKIQQRDGDSPTENIHGVVLFRPKNDNVINSEIPVVLVNFASVPKGNSNYVDELFISIKIICKGMKIQELANGLNRTAVIADMFNNNLNFARMNHLTKVKKQSFKDVSINEENSAYLLTYTCNVLANHLTKNVNYLERNYGVSNYENI
jgi:hypothetical protein